MARKHTPKSRVSNAQGRATRTAILDAAGQLIARKGYAGTSLRDISQASGAGLSSIIYHFHSKQELFLETIRHFVVETAQLERHFVVFDSLDYSDRQAVADAIRDSMRSFLDACHGRPAAEFVIGLYVRIMVEGEPAALGMLLECFAPVQRKLPEVVRRIRPDATDADVAFWLQLYWSQLQYTVMGKQLVLYDMGLPEGYTPEFLDEAAYRFAHHCCLPLGLPEPRRYG